ncbi:zinc metallopeptidase RseP, partial [Vibrio breoganii]
KIVEINGQPIEQWQSVVELIRSNPMKPMSLIVLRNGSEQSLSMTPKSRELSDGSIIGYAGIAPEVAEWPEDYRFELQFGVIESVGKAFDKTGQIIGLT